MPSGVVEQDEQPEVAGRPGRAQVLTGPAERRVVLVSGPPGSGKTTIAGPLAAELGFALLAKDRIKETLHDWLGPDSTGQDQPGQDQSRQDGPGQESGLAWSRRLGAASMELLWAVAADIPAVVLEANFWPDNVRHRASLGSLGATPVEVHCRFPVEECMRRYAERMASRHPAHLDGRESRMSAEAFAKCASPIGLGPVVIIDTIAPVEVRALAEQVRRLLAEPA